MKNKLARVAVALFCFAGTQSAAAAELGFYAGGYIGQTSKDGPREEYEALNVALQEFSLFTPSEQRTSFDEKDIGFAIFAGYRFTRYIAIEGGYTRLGQIRYTSRASGDFPLEPGRLATNIESDTSGFMMTLLGAWPLSRNWELFARVGALIADNDIRFVLVAAGDEFVPPLGPKVSDSFSKSSTDYLAAAGVSRRVLEIYDVRLEYQRVFDAGLEITGGQADLDAILLGLTVTF